MKNFSLIFSIFMIYPMTVHADDSILATLQADSATVAESETHFDDLPIKKAEADSVTHLFWNAQSIQDKVKQGLPDTVRGRFSQADGCDVKSITKSEGSADTCDLNDDPEKNAKFIYNFNVACNHGSYQVSICSRQEAKLLNQLKVTNPSKVVSDDNVFDLESTM